MKQFCTLALLGTTLTSAAFAQNIDYGAFEELFGEKVTASATGKPQRVGDAPVTMEIITAEDIRRSGAAFLPEVLRKYAGIHVIQSTQGQYDVGIRGYNQISSNRLLVLLNGRQILFDHFGEVRWDHLPVQLEEIRQVEIVKGPNSSLYGFNAEQGVINIVTYSPLKDDVTGVTAGVGTQNYRHGAAVATMQPRSNLAVRLSGGNTVADNYTFHDEAVWRHASSVLRNNKVNLDTEYRPDDESIFRFQGNFTDGTNLYIAPTGFTPFTGTIRTTSLQAGYQRDTSMGLLNFDIYRNSLDETGTSGDSSRLLVTKVSDLIKLSSDHTLRLGLEYRHNSTDGRLLNESQFHYDLYAPSAMWDWQLNHDLSLVTSLRHDTLRSGRRDAPNTGAFAGNKDAFDQSVDATSYNMAMLYKLSDNTRWRVATGRGFHIPSLLEFGSASSGLIGNPYLETETNTSYETGVTHNFANGLEIGSNLFYQVHKNLITQQGFSYANNGSSKAYGLELSAKQKLSSAYWGTAVTTIFTDDNARSQALPFEDSTPKLQASLYGGFDLTDTLELSGDVTWYAPSRDRIYDAYTGYTTSSAHDIDSYAVANAQLNYRVAPEVKVSLIGQNLLGAHSEGPETQVSAANTNNGARQIGRSVILNLSYGF